MTQTLIDPRMFDTSQALGAHDGSALTGLPSDVVLLSTSSPSGASTIDLTAFDNATYNSYMILLCNITFTTDGNYLFMRTSTDGGSTYFSSAGYDYTFMESNTNTGSGYTDFENEAQGYIVLSEANVGSAANESLSGQVNIYNAGAAAYTHINWHLSYSDDQAGAYFTNNTGSGQRTAAEDVDAVRFFFNGGTASGTVKLYGIK